MGTIATYNGYVIGQYIRANPKIDSFSAAGGVLFGKWPAFGRELFAAIMVMVLLFIMAAHVVGFQVMMIVSLRTVLWKVWNANIERLLLQELIAPLFGQHWEL